jgi:VWFA-related protein
MSEILYHIFEKYYGGVILIKNKLLAIMVILFLMLPSAFLGCSGGGGDDPPAPRPIIQVLPSSYDFGAVTPGNSPLPLEVEIANNGSAALTVSNITLADPNYVLNLDGGSSPCDTASSTIPARSNCTFEVNFSPGSDGEFNATLTISSNDSSNPTVNVPLSGIRDSISELHVKINQVESTEICPNPVVTAYVSVTDQGGYPVTTLTKDDFSVTEGGTPLGAPTTASFVSNNATISVALVMDYSGSITSLQDSVDDMEESIITFVDNVGANDEAEIIKFATEVKVAQDFTSDKTLLTDAISTPLDVGNLTALYDAVVKAVDDTALFGSKDRKAVIVVTDGVDSDGTDNPQSTNSLNDAINDAKSKGVPIFTVGLGQDINSAILQQIAEGTGGQFYESTSSDNLRTIYQQLADILFYDQYILTYNSVLGAGLTANLTIEATLGAIVGNDTKEITACP